MTDEKPTRTYSNGTITVEWFAGRCIHCENCIKGLPEVFDLQARPWVNVDAASPREIAEQVEECPSGALVFYRNQ
jgi:uncharacterized Fe-S cluster protein YjdI